VVNGYLLRNANGDELVACIGDVNKGMIVDVEDFEQLSFLLFIIYLL
jgi:hypothetical protein